ncbi:hypothetical protein [Methanobrevibacter smithii]|jgi:hypothetical protein|uniref:hypothetical protein n=1 Tax=Methanobrevibacter smithii TaxID=2173 RepID=UPI0037DD54CD
MTAENTIYSEELAKDKYLLELIFNNYYEQERRFQTLESKISSMMFYWVCLLQKDAIKI